MKDDQHDELRVVGDRADGRPSSSTSLSPGRCPGGGPYKRAFPTPEASLGERVLLDRDVVRAGYRGAYL